ncbi:uncharacterized protein EI97DRAFT_384971 [Westerdykella ornata]|uniref:Uncharacterized protein n=1 Tax=Westerdykella ornata TaxID=318751 RepID=A0A6A6J8X8_WESOR|nr:uncharacterized protein EI97DRAFT_384971 [Westerdykella ornata]KAF2272862.1 hypothetical protein EI97DRAFT_384971 [Westerdykella ornata]
MRFSLILAFLSAAMVFGQRYEVCTREVAKTDECLEVINANACYNKLQFRNNQTLSCINGANDNERAIKACKCCTCVGPRMCEFVTKQRITC